MIDPNFFSEGLFEQRALNNKKLIDAKDGNYRLRVFGVPIRFPLVLKQAIAP